MDANAEKKVIKIAEAASDAWWRSSSSGESSGVPLGVVAALSLVGEPDADAVLKLSDDDLADSLLHIWSLFTIIRPELAFRVGPLASWLDKEPRDEATTEAAASVARAAIGAGLFDLTTDRAAVEEVDLLGYLHLLLRSHRTKQQRGEFYTPAHVAELMAEISFASAEPGQSINDPTAGTGGLLRAAARVLRQNDKDPHAYIWTACDIDSLAVAALVVNVHLWNLGPNVLIGCANIITEGDWHVRADQEQGAAIEAQRDRVRIAQMLAMTMQNPHSDSGANSDK